MQQEAMPGDFPPGRVNVTPQAESGESLELHTGDQAGDQSDIGQSFASEESPDATAGAAANIADMIRSSQLEQVDNEDITASEAVAETPAPAVKPAAEQSSAGVASAGEVVKYWNSIADQKSKNGDHDAVVSEAAETGKNPEDVRKYFTTQTEALLNYGHQTARSTAEYGNEVSPTQTVIDTVHQFAKKNHDLIKDGSTENETRRVVINRREAAGGTLEITVRHLGEDTDGPVEERWTAPMLVAPDGNWGRYTVETRSTDAAEGFDEVTTIKGRTMTNEDAARLKTALGETQGNYDLAA